ncbi:MAG TPA: hypothetical protein VK634_01415, partial [Reyranella sp.]|nr:hypothetical protein [Reyranella sp.]
TRDLSSKVWGNGAMLVFRQHFDPTSSTYTYLRGDSVGSKSWRKTSIERFLLPGSAPLQWRS